jgi:hypothetical protein
MIVKEVVKTWVTSGGHAAATHKWNHCDGLIVGFHAIISGVTGNPTVTITFRDQNSVPVIPDAVGNALADGTIHVKYALSNKNSQDADFNPSPVQGPITISIDPSADPGGSAQTLTVTVRLFIQE